jgi:hypothetical protein
MHGAVTWFSVPGPDAARWQIDLPESEPKLSVLALKPLTNFSPDPLQFADVPLLANQLDPQQQHTFRDVTAPPEDRVPDPLEHEEP